ncbi:MAG: ABC transporter permease, partial [Burkholderiales bacterium]|nr:ABC transporter permease [Burkholderiales bacterium]
MKLIKSLILSTAILGAFGTLPLAQAQTPEQYIPILSYRVGPYAAGGSGFYGGAIDYFNLV